MEKILFEDVFHLKQGKHLAISDLSKNGYDVFGANGIVGKFDKYMYEEPTVLITCRGATCGSINLTTPKSWVTGNAIALVPNVKVDAKFIYYQLKGTGFNDVISGSAQPQIIVSTLSRKIFKLFSFEEQQKIASILEQADAARQKRKQANQLSEQFLQSVFVEIFGDPIGNEKKWKIVELEEIISKIDSGWSPVCEEYPRASDNQWAVLKLGAVSYRTFNPLENKKLPSNLKPKENIEVRKHDFLFSRKNTRELVGASVFVNQDTQKLMMSDTIFRFNYLQKKVIGQYLWYLFNEAGFRKCIQALATGSSGSMPNISKEKLFKFKIPLPPLPLQQKFASLVERVEKLREKQRESERHLENLFQALMQKYFG